MRQLVVPLNGRRRATGYFSNLVKLPYHVWFQLPADIGNVHSVNMMMRGEKIADTASQVGERYGALFGVAYAFFEWLFDWPKALFETIYIQIMLSLIIIVGKAEFLPLDIAVVHLQKMVE